eukprot:148123-Amphidinium_carterae.1
MLRGDNNLSFQDLLGDGRDRRVAATLGDHYNRTNAVAYRMHSFNKRCRMHEQARRLGIQG